MPYELIAGAISGLAGFIFKAHANAIDGLKQVAELQIQQQMTADQLANSAAKRSNPLARKILAFVVIGTVFIGLFAVAWASWVPVSIVKEVPQKEFLWGLLKWGNTLKVITADGFVLPEWMGWVLSVIVGFFFGTGAAKPAR